MPATINLQQVFIDYPRIQVYMDVLDESGKPIQNLTKFDFKAAVADQWLPFQSVMPFRSANEGVGYAILVDTSLTITTIRFREMKAAIGLWIDRLGDKDQMALIQVGATPILMQNFTSNHTALKQALDALKLNQNRTALYASLIGALKAFPGSKAPQRRVILVLTDGRDDDDRTGETLRKLFRCIDEQRTPIFAIGVTKEPPPRVADKAIKTLAEIAASSKGLYRPLATASISSLYEEMCQAILRVYVGAISCESCPHDGRNYGFKVDIRGRGSALDQIVILPPQPLPQKVWYHRKPAIIGSALLFLLLLAAVLVWLILHRRKKLKLAKPVAVIPVPDMIPLPLRPSIKIMLAVLGKEKRFEFDVVGRILLGRGEQCDVCLSSDASIGDRQCEIFQRDNALYLRDLEKPGKTAVNGMTIQQPRLLESSDIIRIGNTELRILFGTMR
jgi:Mg-chelatase subunit ChlD